MQFSAVAQPDPVSTMSDKENHVSAESVQTETVPAVTQQIMKDVRIAVSLEIILRTDRD